MHSIGCVRSLSFSDGQCPNLLEQDLHKQADLAIQTFRDSPNKPEANSFPTLQTQSTIFNSILSSSSLSPEEKSTNRIAQEGFVIVVAGGETTARVLTMITFHLLANRDSALLRLRKELTAAMPDESARVDIKTLEQLPWLVSSNFLSVLSQT